MSQNWSAGWSAGGPAGAPPPENGAMAGGFTASGKFSIQSACYQFVFVLSAMGSESIQSAYRRQVLLMQECMRVTPRRRLAWEPRLQVMATAKVRVNMG